MYNILNFIFYFLYLKLVKETVKKQPELKFYLLESIELCDFASRGFTKLGFQELLKGMANLLALRKVFLRNNGITDECSTEIEQLFNCSKVACIDLSYNSLTKITIKIISQVLSTKSNMEWLDLSSNEFSSDGPSIRILCNSLKGHLSLAHFGITFKEKAGDNIFGSLFKKSLSTKNPITSMQFRNSTFTLKSFSALTILLMPPKPKSLEINYLTAISFKNCYLNSEMINKLASVLKINRTLVKLDLSYNGLNSEQLNRFIEILKKDNRTLAHIDLSGNYLDDNFAIEFSKMLKENNVLYLFDISKNPVKIHNTN